MPEDSRLQWEYYIIVDVEGNPRIDAPLTAALKGLDDFCIAKRVLGASAVCVCVCVCV